MHYYVLTLICDIFNMQLDFAINVRSETVDPE